jgi:hypothetical protein
MLHAAGGVSQASLSITAPGRTEPSRFSFWGRSGVVTVDGARPRDETETHRRVIASFREAVHRGQSSEVDARRGLHLQELVAKAESSLAGVGG